MEIVEIVEIIVGQSFKTLFVCVAVLHCRYSIYGGSYQKTEVGPMGKKFEVPLLYTPATRQGQKIN